MKTYGIYTDVVAVFFACLLFSLAMHVLNSQKIHS